MAQSKVPAELARYILLSEWDRAEAEARRKERALAELEMAKRRSRS